MTWQQHYLFIFPVLFADDTSLFLSHTDLSVLIEKANNDLDNISKWFKLNNLLMLI